MAKTFLEAVNELVATWKFAPQGPDRGVLAVKLAQWCEGQIERAEWLIGRSDEFDEYPGPATLRQMVRDKFSPAGTLAPFFAVPAMPAKFKCQRCDDRGIVLAGDRWEWCTCEEADTIKREIPNWLEISNKFLPTPAIEIKKRQRSIEAAEKLKAIYGEEKD